LADLRKKLQSGGTQTKADARQQNIQNSKHILCKRRDTSYLLNKFPERMAESKDSIKLRKPSALHLAANVVEGSNGGAVPQKSIFNLGDGMLLVSLMTISMLRIIFKFFGFVFKPLGSHFLW
jgi:hypothetical protein